MGLCVRGLHISGTVDGNGALDLYVPHGFVTGTDGERPDL